MAELLIICAVTPTMEARLSQAFTLHYLRDIEDRAGWLAENGARVDYVLTDGHLGVPKDIFDALENLKAISSYGVGYDGIDTAAAVGRNIPVSHTPGVLNEEVATTALLLMLACYREILPNAELARSGRWAHGGNLPLSRSADNRTVAILGLGRIGKAIARKLAPFNPRILYTGRSKQDVPFEFVGDLMSMARQADVLISIVPGGEATRHLISADVMAALGPEGILVNVGRGSTVDEPALIEALRDGRLGAAGLDVFEDEPNIPEALRALPNVVLLPHVGSGTVETRAAMGDLSVKNLLQHDADGRMLTPVPECAHLVARAG